MFRNMGHAVEQNVQADDRPIGLDIEPHAERAVEIEGLVAVRADATVRVPAPDDPRGLVAVIVDTRSGLVVTRAVPTVTEPR